MQWKQVISSYWKIIARSSWYILPVLIWRKVCKFWFTIHYFTYLRFQLQDWRKHTAQIKEIHLRFCNKWSQLYYQADMNFFITNFIVKLFFFLFLSAAKIFTSAECFCCEGNAESAETRVGSRTWTAESQIQDYEI